MAYTALSAAVAGFLATGAWLNTYLRDNLNALNGNGKVPPLAIVWWPAAGATKPTTWLECDGTLGVVDLRDKFIVGAGSTYAVHDVGGNLTQALSDHSAHTVNAAAHDAHSINAATAHVMTAFGFTALVSGGTVVSNWSHSGGVTGTSPHSGQALSGGHVHTSSPYSVLPLYTALTMLLKGNGVTTMPTPRTWADGDVPTAAMFNADLRDAFNALRELTLQQSMIILWSGSLSALPSGYQLCDGTNGTPDLRERFAVSAGASYAALGTGGAASLAIPDHANHSATQASAHSDHGLVSVGSHTAGWANNASGSDETDDGSHAVTVSGSHGAHSGMFVSPHASHVAVTTQPPYLALGYITLLTPGTFTNPRTWADGELIDASRINTYMRDNESALNNGQVPIGGILAWHNSVASIPANYALCNGSGGTVDLRDRFPMGAGTTAVAATGGATSVTPSAHTAHGISPPGAHNAHSISQPSNHPNAGVTGSFTGSSFHRVDPAVFNHDFAFSHTTVVEDNHSTGWDVDSGANHSAHAAMSLLPPFHALAFMQRMS